MGFKRMKIIYILIFSLSYLLADVSIDNAWDIVSSKSEKISAYKDDVKRAELHKESAKSMYLPSISLSGTYTHLDEPITLDFSEVSARLALMGIDVPSELEMTEQDIFIADLQLLWPLYTGGKIDAAQDIYKAKVSEAEANYKMNKDKEFLELVKVYYGVVVSKSLYDTRVEAEAALLHHYENAKKLKEQGQIAKVELLDAKVKLDSAKIETRKAQNKYEIASSSLHNKLNTKEFPSSKLFINDNIQSQEYYEEETALHYFALDILDAKSKQSESLIKIEEASWQPQVVAFANYNLYKDDSDTMGMLPTWLAGLTVRIDILDRKDRAQEVQAAKLLKLKIDSLKHSAQKDLKLLAEKTYKEMLLYKEEFESLSSSLDLAEENCKLREIAFKEGLATSVEVVDAQTFLHGTKTSRLNAAYNYVQKISQLCVLSGNSSLFFELKNSSSEVN
ncbi:MAG: outer membrane protein TolC [Sulfurimonas sp.]|jgi:outer membrane protein TolC